MYSFEMKDKFVELRAMGISLDKAAKELGIARNTARKWEKNLKEIIEAGKANRIEELKEKYGMTTEKLIEYNGKQYMAVRQEIGGRDLSKEPIRMLLNMEARYFKILEKETAVPECLSDKEIARKRDERILANNRSLIEVPEDEEKGKAKVIKLRWYDEVPADDQVHFIDDNAAKPKSDTTGP